MSCNFIALHSRIVFISKTALRPGFNLKCIGLYAMGGGNYGISPTFLEPPMLCGGFWKYCLLPVAASAY